jgi:hypothetical protein
MDISLRIGVFRHHDLCQLNARGTHGFWTVGLVHASLIQVLAQFTRIQGMQAFRFVKQDIRYPEAQVPH